jgi:hypothetical protein
MLPDRPSSDKTFRESKGSKNIPQNGGREDGDETHISVVLPAAIDR